MKEDDQRATTDVSVVQADLAEIRVVVRNVKHCGQSVPHRWHRVWRDSDDDGLSQFASESR
jgi:hypothetical protein